MHRAPVAQLGRGLRSARDEQAGDARVSPSRAGGDGLENRRRRRRAAARLERVGQTEQESDGFCTVLGDQDKFRALIEADFLRIPEVLARIAPAPVADPEPEKEPAQQLQLF